MTEIIQKLRTNQNLTDKEFKKRAFGKAAEYSLHSFFLSTSRVSHPGPKH